MRAQHRRCIVSSVIAAATLVASALFVAPIAQAEPAYPDVELAAFWTSDDDVTDTIYMSNNGVDFQKISVAYQADKNTGHVTGKPDYVYSLHDPGLFYVNGNFWMISGFVQKQGNLGYRFTPMLGSSSDLVNWSYPNSGSSDNLKPTVTPPKAGADGSYDTAGTDAMADSDGSVWIVTTLGYYGANHGQPEHDTMKPYIVKASGLRPGADQSTNPGAQPQLQYGNLVPINLPDNGTDWLDPALYKEGDTYYLSIKKNGVTNQIYSIQDLNQAQDRNAWKLVNANVVTGYEGPSLTKYKGQYYMYTDKLKDYPYGHADGKAGEFVTQSNSLASGWRNTRKITTNNVEGRSIPNRHGSVITVTDPAAKKVIWEQREKAGYGAYRTDAAGNPLNGWVEENGKKYWYDEGAKAVSKEVYDPQSDSWYWFDKDGSMATDKDVYIPAGDKWVRYDSQGRMRKGEDYRYGDWYFFDLTTGAMRKGIVHVNSNGGKWVYYDWITGQMRYGETYVNYDAEHTGWYLFDNVTGAMFHGDTYVRSNGGKWVRYDRVSGKMVKGLQYQDAAWYYFLPATGAMQKGNVYVPEWHKWHWFDTTTGRG